MLYYCCPFLWHYMNTLASLVKIGFTINEAKTYLFLLIIAEGTAFQIAKGAQIPRTTTYAALESLKKQGIVTSYLKNNVQYFGAENPKQIATNLEQRQAILAEVLPSLQALSVETSINPSVKMLTGVRGMRAALDDILDTLKKMGEKTLYAASYPDVMDALPKYYHKWVSHREALGVVTKMIVPESAKSRNIFYEGHNRQVRFMPQPYLFQCSMDIYGNKIVFFSLREGMIYSIILESSTISDAFRRFFLFAFDRLPG